MSEWDFVEYQSLASREKSSFSMGPFGSKITKEHYMEQGVPLIRGNNLAQGIFLDQDFAFISDEKADDILPANVASGDIIFTHRGTIGQVTMIPRSPKHDRYAIGSSQVKTRLNESMAHPEFYYYWFHSPMGQRSILANTSTVGVPGIATPLTSIRNIRVPNPPLKEQQGIASMLGALDGKIAVKERIAELSEELCRLLVTAHADQSSRTSVESLCTLNKKQVAPATLSTAHVHHYSLPAFDKGKLPEHSDPQGIKSNKFVVTSPSVLISKLNPEIPRIWNIPEVGPAPNLASTEFLVFEPRSEISTHELWAVTSQTDFTASLAARVTGTSKSHQRVRPAEVLATEVVDPRTLGAVRGQVSALSSRSIAAISESRTLAQLRDTLLPQLMSGKLRVKDAEKAVEDHV